MQQREAERLSNFFNTCSRRGRMVTLQLHAARVQFPTSGHNCCPKEAQGKSLQMKNHSAVQRCLIPCAPLPVSRFPFPFRFLARGFRPSSPPTGRRGPNIFIVFCSVWQSHIHSHSFIHSLLTCNTFLYLPLWCCSFLCGECEWVCLVFISVSQIHFSGSYIKNHKYPEEKSGI